MSLLHHSSMYKLIIYSFAAMSSLSAIASDFNQVQQSANRSDAEAQYNLGFMYVNGEGTSG